MIDKIQLQSEIERAANNKKDFDDVPLGIYEVKIEKLELVETSEQSRKPGVPMVKIWFRILRGEFKDRLIFFNRIILGTNNDGLAIHTCNEFLKSLQTSETVKFNGFQDYAELLLNIYDEIDRLGIEYALKYSENANGYKNYEIVEVFKNK